MRTFFHDNRSPAVGAVTCKVYGTDNVQIGVTTTAALVTGATWRYKADVAAVTAAMAGTFVVYDGGVEVPGGSGAFGPEPAPTQSGFVAMHVSGSGVSTYYAAASDTDAARGTAILAAQTAASDGTIYVYGDAVFDTPLGKNGLLYVLSPGITLSPSVDSVSHLIFDDGGSAMRFAVYGPEARLLASDDGGIARTAHATSRVHFDVLSANNNATLTAQANFTAESGYMYIRAKESINTQYDCLWAKSGTIEFDIGVLDGNDNAIEISDGTGGVVRGRSRRIIGRSTESAVIANGTTDQGVGDGTIDVVCDSIEALGALGTALYLNGVASYVRANRIIGTIIGGNSTLPTHVHADTIDTTAINSSSVTLEGDNFILQGATIRTKANQTNSMSAASGRTVKVIGQLDYNKALSNVTLDYAKPTDALTTSRLAPTTAARTLDVTAAGNAGIDWANVEAPTTTLNLTGTTVKANNSAGSLIMASADTVIQFEGIGLQNTALATALTAVGVTATTTYTRVVLALPAVAPGLASGLLLATTGSTSGQIKISGTGESVKVASDGAVTLDAGDITSIIDGINAVGVSVDAASLVNAVYVIFQGVTRDGQQFSNGRFIFAGDDYSAAARPFLIVKLALSEWPTNLSESGRTWAATIAKAPNNDSATTPATIAATVAVVTATGDGRTVRVSIAGTATDAAIGPYTYEVVSTKGGEDWTVEAGTLLVKTLTGEQ